MRVCVACCLCGVGATEQQVQEAVKELQQQYGKERVVVSDHSSPGIAAAA